jgi:hypothetical protein
MSRIKNCSYLIEYKDGSNDVMSKDLLEESLDDIFDSVSKIVKKYRLHNYNEEKKVYKTTLFTCDHNFTAYEYIDHYRNLPTDIYGPFVLDEFDIEIIQMFN